MIVAMSVVIGFINSQAAAAYFEESKALREITLLAERAAIESTKLWLPYLIFLGLEMVLRAIVMVLGTIAKRLCNMGKVIFSQLPENIRPAISAPPQRIRLFQLSAMMGIMVLLIVLIVGIVLAAGVVSSYWDNSIANELNPTQPGSALLAQLSVISSYAFWLNPLRMVGMAFIFTAIPVALTVIIGTLRMQTNLLSGLVHKAG